MYEIRTQNPCAEVPFRKCKNPFRMTKVQFSWRSSLFEELSIPALSVDYYDLFPKEKPI